jgi:hypothetical protein
MPVVQFPPVWTEASPPGEAVLPTGKGHTNLGVTARWPLVDYVWDVGNSDILPPPNAKLSDAWMYIVLHAVSPTTRGKCWPYDFTADGSIRSTRRPQSPTVFLIKDDSIF